jgi:hypothetical protein
MDRLEPGEPSRTLFPPATLSDGDRTGSGRLLDLRRRGRFAATSLALRPTAARPEPIAA